MRQCASALPIHILRTARKTSVLRSVGWGQLILVGGMLACLSGLDPGFFGAKDSQLRNLSYQSRWRAKASHARVRAANVEINHQFFLSVSKSNSSRTTRNAKEGSIVLNELIPVYRAEACLSPVLSRRDFTQVTVMVFAASQDNPPLIDKKLSAARAEAPFLNGARWGE